MRALATHDTEAEADTGNGTTSPVRRERRWVAALLGVAIVCMAVGRYL